LADKYKHHIQNKRRDEGITTYGKSNMTASLKALQLKARHQVYTLLSGHNLSKLHGEGYDFSELREYQIGDDIRKINWTISAKLGKPYIKELHSNRELSVVTAALMDGNLYFGAGNEKQKKITEVATVLGYAAQQNADLFTGFAYMQNEVYATPPSKQIYHIEQYSKILFERTLLGTKVEYNVAIQDLFKRIRKPSLIFIIGDFLEPVDLSLLAQKHEVIAIIIRNKEEEDPKKLGEVTLIDPQTSQKIDTYFAKKGITEYLEKLQEHDASLQEHFACYDIRSVKIFTEDETVSKLTRLFI
jgi:uncharacterized protein (DUF58 family)